MSQASSWKDSFYNRLGLKERRYDQLNQSDASSPDTPQPSQNTARRKFIKVAGGLALFWILILALATPYSDDITDYIFSNNAKPAYFHVLIPANKGSPEVCKTIFSAALLDYPTPRLINWGKEYEDPDVAYGGAHIAKIEGVLEFLNLLGPPSDEEMVLIIDGFDTWFQLRPSTLLDRYHAINDRANKRIAARIGSAGMKSTERPIRQTVVFAAQKRCWPASQDDSECYAVPESDLPTDIYGPLTDQDSGDQEAPFTKYRQRYLNSGTIMGPVGDIKRIFNAALVKAKEQPASRGSDQAAFAALFGAQEYQRELIRAEHLTSWQKFWAKLYHDGRDEILTDHPTHKKPELATSSDPLANEYGIGLDYRSELSLPTVFSEDDAIWLSHSSAADIRSAATKAGVPIPDPPRVSHLPQDIVQSTPPFWTSDYTGGARVPASKSWADISLFTNLWTGVSPVTIHHNAHAYGLKSRLRTTWRETWYFPYLREILKTKAVAYRMPVAVSRGQEWWDPIDERAGVRFNDGHLPGGWRDWDSDELCGTSEIAEGVFGDGWGKWVNPTYYLSWNNDEQNAVIEKLKAEEDGLVDLQE
jgi:hypothetical protein